jgi:hypothetical protein
MFYYLETILRRSEGKEDNFFFLLESYDVNTSNNFKEEDFEADAQWCKLFNDAVDKGSISIVTMDSKEAASFITSWTTWHQTKSVAGIWTMRVWLLRQGWK